MSMIELLALEDSAIAVIVSASKAWCERSQRDIDSEFGQRALNRAILLFKSGYRTHEGLLEKLSRRRELVT